MLFTCFFLLQHANYALNYTNWRSPWDRCVYFRFRSRCVWADIGTLEMLVYNLKSIGNLINLNMSFTVSPFHFGRYCQLSIELKRKLDGTSIANFMNKNTISPHKITYLACHSSAIYTCKVTCLSCMLFTCLFLLPHVNYALNYILIQVVDKCWQVFEMAPPKLYSTLHAEMRYLLPVSHRSSFGGYGH